MTQLPEELRIWAEHSMVIPTILKPLLLRAAKRIEDLERAIHLRPQEPRWEDDIPEECVA